MVENAGMMSCCEKSSCDNLKCSSRHSGFLSLLVSYAYKYKAISLFDVSSSSQIQYDIHNTLIENLALGESYIHLHNII